MFDFANVSLSEYVAVMCSSFSRMVIPCCSTILPSSAFAPCPRDFLSFCTAANSSGVYFFDSINSRMKPRACLGLCTESGPLLSVFQSSVEGQ